MSYRCISAHQQRFEVLKRWN